jgi:hypothetical protein
VPRRTRTRQARRNEARAQADREAVYAELETELHREWWEQSVNADSTLTEVIEPASDCAEP